MKLPHKVLQISPAYFPATSIGGPIFTNLTFSKALVSLGCEVEVVTTTQGLTAEQIQGIDLGNPNHTEFEYPIYRFRYYGYSHFTFSPGLFIWLLRNMKRFDLVVFQAVWNFPIWAGYILCKWANKPYLIIPHGSLYPETVGLKSSWKKKLFLSLYVRNMLKHARRVLFSTKHEQEKVLAFLNINAPSAILPNILDLSPYQNLPTQGQFRRKYAIDAKVPLIVHYGRISLKKGIRFVLEALPSWIQLHPNLLYVIAGGDEEGYAADLQLIINELGISNHVLFTGLLNQSDGINLLRDADVFVLPSLSENFGMSVVEAMLCETPVVLSDQVGIASDLAAAQCARVLSNPHSLKDVVLELLENESKRKDLGMKGANFAKEHYSFEVLRERMKSFLLI
jgi:glycosyltransferase involved in cell wall biosynthesis